MSGIIIRSPWLWRPAMAGAAACGFAVLYLFASRFTGEYTLGPISEEIIRGIAHFVGYGTLALLAAKGLGNQYLLAWMISLVLATGEELHQLVVPCRAADVGDWLINFVGISTFIIAAFAVDAFFLRRDH